MFRDEREDSARNLPCSALEYQGRKFDLSGLRNPGTLMQRNLSGKLRKRLTRPHRELSAQEVEDLDWVFEELAQPHLGYGVIRAAALECNAKEQTVRSWRKKLLQDPKWRPNRDKHCRRDRLTEEQEKKLQGSYPKV